ncbi:hypothetical protein WJX72_009866 [[Myrmecia] bisecta]|uniref:Uncharacterized protein n=1 Tax=[Myrmecia] bisecta TaxID=41462 RepID=A0AAW1R8P0_9CHLO
MSSDATSEEFVKQLAECLAGPISDEDVARFLDAYDQVPASTQEAELVAALLKQARQLPVCSESPTSTPAGQAAAGEMWEPRAEVTIDVQENKFFPTEITLLPGGKVSWAAAPGCHLPQTIELVDDATGQVVDELALSSTCRSQTRTFDSAGEFCFQSNIYTFMRGSISVPTASGRPAQAETSGSEGEEYDRSVMAARKQTSSSSRGMSTDGAPAVSARAAPTTRSIGVSTMADSDCFAQQRGSASPPANGDMTWQQAVQAAAAAALPPEWPSAAEDERILPPSVYPADMPSPKLGERIDGRQWYRCRAKQCGRKAFLSDFNSLRCSAQHSGGRKLVAAPDLQPLKAFWSGLSVQEASALVKLTDDAEGRRFLRCMKLEELKGREEELTAEGHPSHIRTGRRAPSSSQYAAAGQLLRGLAMKGLKKPLSADLMFKWLQDAAEGTLLYAFHPDQIPWQLHPAPGAQNIESVFAAHIEARLVKVYQAQREQDALKHRQELEAAEDAAKQRAAEKKAKKLQKAQRR